MSIKKAGVLIGCLVFCYAAAALGSWATLAEIKTWYVTLAKPFFNPPNWLFGPVWTLLYTAMGISLYLVIVSNHLLKQRAIIAFVLQLILNVAWSFLFFKYHVLWIAFLEIIMLLISIIYYTYLANKINKYNKWLLLPYIFWVSFATILNFSIAYLN